MLDRKLVTSILLLPVLIILKRVFHESICSFGLFACIVSFIAFYLASIIIIAYWIYKIYLLWKK